jgi:hypothetical protein
VDDGAAGEVERAQLRQPSSAPDPVGEGTVDEQRPQRREDPVMSPTVMIANIPWYMANTLVGIAEVPVPVTEPSTPSSPRNFRPPTRPPMSGPNASV